MELIDESEIETVHDPLSEIDHSYTPSDRNGVRRGRKYNFSKSWSRENFDSQCMQPIVNRNGHLQRDINDEVTYEM